MLGFLGIASGLKGGELAFALVRKLWWLVPVIGLTVALLLTQDKLADRTTERDQYRDALTLANDRLLTTKKSLDGARAEIDASNRAAEDARLRLEVDRLEAAKAESAAEARYQTTKAQVAGLIAASRRPRPPCTISREASHALEGL